MSNPPKPRSLRRALLDLVWQQPIWAIPFALFFGTIYGPSLAGYLRTYQVSLVFAYVIGVAMVAYGEGVLARLNARRPPGRPVPLWVQILGFLMSGVAASFAAMAIVERWLAPGFIGISPRVLLVTGMYALLFSAFGTGLAYAFHFYHRSLDQARSEQELDMARRIQRSFLLTQFPSMPRLEVHAYNRSSREASGDFYDVVPAEPGAFLVAIADVAGKGVPAALLASMLQASLRTQAPTVRSVSQILGAINRLAHRSTAVHQFATVFLARVDEERLTLDYSNAGHNAPLLLRTDGSYLSLDVGGTVVGILEDLNFEQAQVVLRPGDRLIMYTDGVSEAESPAGALFGDDRVRTVAAALDPSLSAREVIEALLREVDGHLSGRDAGDDITLLVLRVLGGPAASVGV